MRGFWSAWGQKVYGFVFFSVWLWHITEHQVLHLRTETIFYVSSDWKMNKTHSVELSTKRSTNVRSLLYLTINSKVIYLWSWKECWRSTVTTWKQTNQEIWVYPIHTDMDSGPERTLTCIQSWWCSALLWNKKSAGAHICALRALLPSWCFK